MSRNDSDQVFAFVFFGSVGLGALLVWQFSTALGLDMASGFKIIFGGLVACLALGAAWWHEGQSPYGTFFSVRNVWPVALGIIWMGLWPALNVWGSDGLAWAGYKELTWWAEWYTKGLGLVILVGGGWWLNWLLSERY